MAFCALGTGRLQYPAESVAVCFVNAVTEYCKKTPHSGLRNAMVVAYDKDQKTMQVWKWPQDFNKTILIGRWSKNNKLYIYIYIDRTNPFENGSFNGLDGTYTQY